MEKTQSLQLIDQIINELNDNNEGRYIFTVITSAKLIKYLSKELNKKTSGIMSNGIALFSGCTPELFTVNEIQYYGMCVEHTFSDSFNSYSDDESNERNCCRLEHVIFSKVDDFDALEKYLNDKYKDYTEPNPCKVMVWNNDYGQYRESEYDIENQSQDSLIGLDDFFNQMERDLRAIIERETLARKLGADSGFNYLIYGPPGTGKTSSIKALTRKMKLPAYYCNMANMHRSSIIHAMNPKDKNKIRIVLCEDFDRYIKNCQNDSHMSDLLNALDGIHSTLGTIRIFSANMPEIALVDTALRSRIARFIKFDLPTNNMILGHLNKVFPDHEADANEFVKLVDGMNLSIREINHYLSRFIIDNDPLKEAIVKFPDWLKEQNEIKALEESKKLEKEKKEKESKDKNEKFNAIRTVINEMQFHDDFNDDSE